MSNLPSRIAEPFVELYHELCGGTSASQRAAAMALQTPAPRTEEIGNQVARLHAPWWGFAAWGAVYAMTVMAIAAAFATVAVEWVAVEVFSLNVDDHWGVLFWIALALTAPITILPLRRWVRQRRGGLVEVARHGEVAAGQISAATIVAVQAAFKSSAHSTHLSIATPLGVFKGYVPGEPSWVAVGQPVDVVALPGSAFAILLAPDGGCRPLTRPAPHSPIPKSYVRA